MAKPLKPFVRSGGYYPSAKYTPLVYPGGYTTLNAKNGKPEPINTFIGKIARFLAKRSLPMVKLEANFTPIQDFNGQEAPYPPGGGANKWDEEWEVGDINATTGENTSGSTTIRTKNYIPVNPGETYYCKIGNLTGANMRARWYGADKSYLGTNPVVSYNNIFTVPNDAYYLRFTPQANYGTTYNHDIAINYPSSVTTYSPYSNICPISGHTGCEINRTGKNLLDEMEPGTINQSTGQNDSTSSSYSRAKGYIGVVPGQTYTIGKFSGSANFRLFYYGSDKSYLGTELVNNQWVSSGLYKYTFTASDNVHFIRFQSVNTAMGDYINTMQVELGSTASDYEPYTGTTVSISFGTTVYGGKLTVFEDGSGQIVATHKGHTFNGSERWDLWNGVFVNYDLTDAKQSDLESLTNIIVIADRFKSNGVTYRASCGDGNIIKVVGANTQIACYSSAYANETAFKASLVSDPMTVVYELAEPITIPLTPGQIQTLVGENVVWVNDSDNIQVTAYGTEIV